MERKKFQIEEKYIDQILLWWVVDKDKRIFILTGYAGCGKTTLARSIPELLDLYNVVFLAPTGKAANVMSGDARTIHSYLYHTEVIEETGEFFFHKKEPEEFEEDLLIVDEISMVSDELLADLIATGIPIIGLGDPAQLPPVNGSNTILNNPDIFLTHVWRNDGGILDLATDIRNGKRISWSKYENVQRSFKHISVNYDLVDDESIIICKFNKTRRQINKQFRELVRGYELLIQKGEKLIITKNNKQTNLMNGSIVIVEEIAWMDRDSHLAGLKVKTQDGYSMFIKVSLLVVEGYEEKLHRDPNIHYCDYAYAITCHKAQGSEYKNVFIIDEGAHIGDHQSWRYTAVTRARQKVYIYQ